MPVAPRVAAAVALLMLAGCAASPDPAGVAAPSSSPPVSTQAPTPATSTPATSTSASARASSPAATTIPASLQFTGTTVDGRPFDGATLAGKPVLLWFWAPWCPTCRGQVDDVQAVARDYSDRVTVLGVGSLDDAKAIERFAADAPGMTHLSDDSGAVFRHFQITQQSSFVLLDRRGEKVWSVGYGGSDDLADQVERVAG